MSEIDWTKKEQKTRDGRDVVILSTEGPGTRKVVGYIKGDTGIALWFKDGSYSIGGTESPMDIVPQPKVHKVTVHAWLDKATNRVNISCVNNPFDYFGDTASKYLGSRDLEFPE